LGDRPAHDEHDRRRGGQQQAGQREHQLQRAQFPHRPALVDLVDAVHRPAERADVTGRRPHRTQQAGDQRDACRGRLHQLLDRRAQQVHCITGNHAGGRFEHGVDGLTPLTEHAEQRHQRQKGRKQRQDRVIREGRRQVGALILLEFAHCLAENEQQRPLGQVGGRVRLARIVGVRLVGGRRLVCGHIDRYPVTPPSNGP
jgi:hypothetical protein